MPCQSTMLFTLSAYWRLTSIHMVAEKDEILHIIGLFN